MRAGEDLDERGLSRTILTEEAVHLAGQDFKVNTVERLSSREVFDNVSHMQQRLLGVYFDHVPKVCGLMSIVNQKLIDLVIVTVT